MRCRILQAALNWPTETDDDAHLGNGPMPPAKAGLQRRPTPIRATALRRRDWCGRRDAQGLATLGPAGGPLPAPENRALPAGCPTEEMTRPTPP
jgi:hypothetical protein